MKRYEIIGVLLTLLGAVLWGVSGASVQFLSNYRDMNLEWLVTMRLITAGLLTVIYAWFKYGNSIFHVFRSLKDQQALLFLAYLAWLYANIHTLNPLLWQGPVLRRCFNTWRHQ